MRWVATRIGGDGTESLIADEIPVAEGRVHRALSGAGGASGTVQVEVARLAALTPGTTALYCLTAHGLVLGGGILQPETARQGGALRLNARGHAGFLAGMPYDGNDQWIETDPADLIRHAWTYTQSLPRHDLGVVVDETRTPVRIGEEERDVEFTTSAGEEVEFTAGPIKWNYWTTHDLGSVVDRLAMETPIEYAMTHLWDRKANVPSHQLRLGYPRLGRRRMDLAFNVGVNVDREPIVTTGGDVSRVLVVGAGEGSEARRGMATRSTTALGRTHVVMDKALTSNAACRAEAQRVLDWLSGEDELSTLTVMDHPNAPLGSWQVGDDIRVVGSGAGWGGGVDMWVRVLSDETEPETGRATLTVTRAERT